MKPFRVFFSTERNLSPLFSRAYILIEYLKRLSMLQNLHSNARGLFNDVNNFLKNEAEIMTDFKTRITAAAKEIDNLQSAAHITYNRIINKLNEAECMAFLSDQTLFMEENY